MKQLPLILIALLCFSMLAALNAKCKYSLIKPEIQDPGKIIYKRNDGNKIVTVLRNSEVSIRNKKAESTCHSKIDQVNSVFWGQGDVIVLRSGNAVQDYLNFIDSKTCTESRRLVNLPLDKKKSSKKLKSLGICS